MNQLVYNMLRQRKKKNGVKYISLDSWIFFTCVKVKSSKLSIFFLRIVYVHLSLIILKCDDAVV